MELFFDTETTGMALFGEPPSHKGQPHMVQLGAILSTEDEINHRFSILVEPIDWSFDPKAVAVHGITEERARKYGLPESAVVEMFIAMMRKADVLICHNVSFDAKIMAAAIHRYWGPVFDHFMEFPKVCTMEGSTEFCGIPGRYGKKKWPRLSELHMKLFNEPFEGAHDALNDIEATRRCYYELKRLEVL